ncbi:MAG: FtsX-like permease family protein [Thermoanaerobaculia bacterium]|nr:FtsX-like permease family protein [Thermoanaerobaculia bacterium]
MALSRVCRLAFLDLVHRPGRTAAALAGVIFAVVLLFMQSGFYLACRDSATRIHDLLEFDVLITSARYAFVLKPDAVERDRVLQARAVPGVADVMMVQVGPGQWRSPGSGSTYDLVLLGIDPADRPFALESLDDDLPQLHRGESVIFDAAAHPILGHNPPGTRTEFEGRSLRVVDSFRWGAGFVANGIAVASQATFAKAFPGRPPSMAQLGLVRAETGVSAAEVARRLRNRLPADIEVWTRDAIEDRDRRFFLAERPIGLMFTSGVVLALLVGGVIIFQLLASEVASRRPEFATLKALGYGSGEVYGVVVAQGFLYTLAAFLPAVFLAALLFEVTRRLARLPMRLDPLLCGAVLVASLVMCLSGALMAARKVRQADPADLF